jgi:hypothetical protein
LNKVLFLIEITPLFVFSTILVGVILLQLFDVFSKIKIKRQDHREISLIEGGYFLLKNNSAVYIMGLLPDGREYQDLDGNPNRRTVRYKLDKEEYYGVKEELFTYLKLNNAKPISTVDGKIVMKVIQNKINKI